MKIKIITPIWTGDIDLKSDLLQSTGILGSLRCWTEAILRSMGKFACDPAGDERCPKKIKDEMQYCPACLIFGATGIRRLFRLEISGGEKIFDGGAINIKPQQRNRGWYLGSGLKGEIDLCITPLDRDFDENLVLIPLAIAAKWGGMGAKTQHGYGVVELVDKVGLRFENFKKAVEKILENKRVQKLNIKERNDPNDALPNIKEMFFAKVQFEVQNNDWWKEVDGIAKRNQREQRNFYEGFETDQRMINWVNNNSVPISPAIKNWLRYGKQIKSKNDKLLQVSPFSEVSNSTTSNWLFGESRDDKKSASKINVSCAYKINNTTWEFRIWGWIPEGLQGFNRNNFLDKLKQALDGNGTITIPWTSLLGNKTNNHRLKVWREFNSPRDTVEPNQNEIDKYLQSLLNEEGGN
jgi:CRISPR-associated protein Cmr1